MPEGDTVAGDAERLRPLLVGNEILAVAGTAPSVRSSSARLLGSLPTAVRSIGKNLIIDFSTGYSIRVHRGMTGRWQVMGADHSAHGSARLVLTTSSLHVVCHSAPTVEVARTPLVDRSVARLGPDVLGEFDAPEFLRRARAGEDRAIASLLLDQRVLAGVGNVYKSELLFLAGINPWAPVSSLDDDQLMGLAEEARRLLASNVGRHRTTTGSARRGQETWVYGQAGHGCRECGATISMARLDDRVTYWCPVCQNRAS